MSNIAEINIMGLKFKTIIGVLPKEKKQKQKIIFDILLKYDATKAIKSDNEKDVVSYATICILVKKLVETKKYSLLETLLKETVNLIKKDARITYCKVSISKPKALKKFGAMVMVSMEG